jgi:hypothetical protein
MCTCGQCPICCPFFNKNQSRVCHNRDKCRTIFLKELWTADLTDWSQHMLRWTWAPPINHIFFPTLFFLPISGGGTRTGDLQEVHRRDGPLTEARSPSLAAAEEATRTREIAASAAGHVYHGRIHGHRGIHPLGYLASGAGKTPSSTLESTHKAPTILPWFRPREGISRKTLHPACLSLLKKIPSASLQWHRRLCLKASNHRTWLFYA